MANSTLQMVAEALRESQDEDDGAWHFDCEAGAQAAISTFKQSDEWKGVVEALTGASRYLRGMAHESGNIDASADLIIADALDAALNKLNGGGDATR